MAFLGIDLTGVASPEWREHMRKSRVPRAQATAERYPDDTWAVRYAQDVMLLLNTVDALIKERNEPEGRNGDRPQEPDVPTTCEGVQQGDTALPCVQDAGTQAADEVS